MHSLFPEVVSYNQGGVSEAVSSWLVKSPIRNVRDYEQPPIVPTPVYKHIDRQATEKLLLFFDVYV